MRLFNLLVIVAVLVGVNALKKNKKKYSRAKSPESPTGGFPFGRDSFDPTFGMFGRGFGGKQLIDTFELIRKAQESLS